MNQLVSTKVKERIMRVPCTGMFHIKVESDGYYEVRLEHKNGNAYIRTRGHMTPPGVFIPLYVRNTDAHRFPPLQDWMWDSICGTIAEMEVEFERDALSVPQYRQGEPV